MLKKGLYGLLAAGFFNGALICAMEQLLIPAYCCLGMALITAVSGFYNPNHNLIKRRK